MCVLEVGTVLESTIVCQSFQLTLDGALPHVTIWALERIKDVLCGIKDLVHQPVNLVVVTTVRSRGYVCL